MTRQRLGTIPLATLLVLHGLAGVAWAQRPEQTSAPTPPPAPQRYEQPARQKQTIAELQSEIDRLRQERRHRRASLSLFRNYTLQQGEETPEVVTVLADARIDGTVHSDVVVVMGTLTLGSTAVVEGSLIVPAGSAVIQNGAKVGRDIVVVGGTLDAPADFVQGGEQVIVGTPIVGDWLKALSPWLTRGLLLGRVIVPGLGWVWMVVLVSFLLGLIINQMFFRQVGACADTLARRPGGSFFVGLLVILLAGPALAIVSITVIGLPFAIVALIAATVIGKVAVTRAIGRGMAGEGETPTRGRAAMSFVIGAAVITFAYMVPVIGLMTWALVGVFGLGTATMTFISSVRRERPSAPPAAPVEPTSPAPPPPSAPVVDMPASAFTASEPGAGYSAADVYQEVPPPVAPPVPPPPAATVPPPVFAPPASAGAGFLAYPRATFLDRLAAVVLDLILVAIASNVIQNAMFYYRHDEGGWFFFMMLAYHVAFWAWKGTTLGGIICNLRIVRTDGEDPRFIDALVRGLTAIFSAAAIGMGFFWMLYDRQGQTWHDKVAGTVVLKVPRHVVLAERRA